MQWLSRNAYRVVVHLVALVPLVWIGVEFATNGDSYTFNRNVELLTGAAGLALIVASFACTPISWLFNLPQAVQVRRALGLYGFLYIALHIFAYAWFDNFFDVELIWRDLGERPAMAAGFVAFVLLIPLAATSTRGWQKRLGKNWRALHRLIYLAVPLSVLHFMLLDRDILTVPILYAIVVAVLLLLRLSPVRQFWRRLRMRVGRPSSQGPKGFGNR